MYIICQYWPNFNPGILLLTNLIKLYFNLHKNVNMNKLKRDLIPVYQICLIGFDMT